MSTNDRTDVTYGVTDDERLQLLIEELIERKQEETKEIRRLADAVERLNDHMEAREEVDAR
jgi:FtsZ-binding cell division protein ZapB